MSLTIAVDSGLELRLVEPQHAAEIASAVQQHHQHIARWMPWAIEAYDEQEARKWITMALAEFGQRKQLPLSILDQGSLVGGIGWTAWENINHESWELTAHTADIGYWLIEPAQGRGLITRSCRRLLDYAFDDVGMDRVTIRAEPENVRSWSVAERLGFQFEGTARHMFRWKGRWVDHRNYAMLAEEWPAARAAMRTRN